MHAGGRPEEGLALSCGWRGGDGVWEEDDAVRGVFYVDQSSGRVASGQGCG